MKILFVEDNQTFAATIEERLRRIPHVEPLTVGSRDEAVAALRGRYFDIILLDLTIPTQPGALDASKEHGQAVFYDAKLVADGTPIYFLTGSEPDTFALSLARQGQSVDLWGSGRQIPTIDYVTKEAADQLVTRIESLAAELAVTDAISIDTWGRKIILCPEDKRALRAFTRHSGGTSCVVRTFGPGLSGADVLRVQVKDERGNATTLSVAKLGTSSKLAKESEAYRAVARLRMGAYTPLLMKNDKGLRGRAAIFYALAAGYDRSLFEVVAADPARAHEVIQTLRGKLAMWIDARYLERVLIRDIRRRVLSDDGAAALAESHGIDTFEEIEALYVPASRACNHGDLHCGNVLVDSHFSPVLIDFGDVGDGFAALDPITLELSLIFHPAAVAAGISNELQSRLPNWLDMDAFSAGLPFASALRVARQWSHEVGGSDRAVLANAYAFALRQLKYKDVDPSVAKMLLTVLSAELLESE
jgi:CheY-like chemotaxis protein